MKKNILNHDMKRETKGERLKYKIQACGYSQREFAQLIDVSAQMISLYIGGRSDMSPRVLKRAAEVLNTSVDYLSLRSDNDTPEYYVQMTQDVDYADADAKEINKLLFRTAHIRELLQTMGVRISSTAIVNNKSYFCNISGEWIDEAGRAIDLDEMLEEIRKNHNEAEFCNEITYRGDVITMSQEELNSWLINLWNYMQMSIQSTFGFFDPVGAGILDDDIIRALKGLPAIDRRLQIKRK